MAHVRARGHSLTARRTFTGRVIINHWPKKGSNALFKLLRALAESIFRHLQIGGCFKVKTMTLEQIAKAKALAQEMIKKNPKLIRKKSLPVASGGVEGTAVPAR